MLVLSRKVGEQLAIGEGEDRAVLMVTSVRGNHVSLGIEASHDVRVVRCEIKEKSLPVDSSYLCRLLGKPSQQDPCWQWNLRVNRGTLLIEWEPLRRELQLCAISPLSGNPVSVCVLEQPQQWQARRLIKSLGREKRTVEVGAGN